MIIIPIKWLFHWEYTQHFQTNPCKASVSPSIVLQLLKLSDINFADRRLRRRCNYFGNILAFRRQQLLKSWNLDSTMLLHSDNRGSYWWLEKSFWWELFCKARGLRELIKSSRIEALNPVAHDQQVVLVTLAGRIYTIGRNLAHPLQDGVKACQTTCYSDLGCQSEPQAALQRAKHSVTTQGTSVQVVDLQ